MTDSQPPNSATAAPARRRIPLALVLVGGITLLIVLSAGSVLYISLRQATENTFSLLADKADSNLDLLEAQLDTLLGPTRAAGTELALRIGEGEYTVDDPGHELHHLLRGGLAALPRANAVIFVDTESRAVRMARIDGAISEIADNPFLQERQELGLARAASMNAPNWVEPVWIPLIGEPILSFIAPVRRNGDFIGALVIATRIGELAEFLEAIERETGVRAFILYDNEYVLGHPELLKQGVDMSGAFDRVALPSIDTFREDAFRLLHDEVERAEVLLGMSHIHDAPLDDEFILLIREIRHYGETPWQIVLRFRQDEVSGELTRLWIAGAIGLSILVVALVIGYLFARNLNRQIGRLATTADRLRRLEIADLPDLPDSRIRELSNAARAFNAMNSAMRWFGTYVPRTLVERLIEAGSDGTASQERELTILFTDIRGFSTLVEHMAPNDTASLLNRHFELVAACIEAEGGTVDKFIGDSIMAFWGAPHDQPDHAGRALRAAAAIQAAIFADNADRRAAGEPPIAIRLGLHTGPVTVGNIGSANRINYTVIGDTVNVAARLESFAKELDIDADCVALISGATLAAAGGAAPDGTAAEHLGEVPVRGREGKVEVYRLTG